MKKECRTTKVNKGQAGGKCLDKQNDTCYRGNTCPRSASHPAGSETKGEAGNPPACGA